MQNVLPLLSIAMVAVFLASSDSAWIADETLLGYGVTEIADRIAHQIKKLDRKPILIGQSGGILVQNLLGRELAADAIAIDHRI